MCRQLIDFHVHCFPDYLAHKAISSVHLGNESPVDGTVYKQEQWLDTNSIEKCVILNMASRPDTMHQVNEFALSIKVKKFFVFGSVHPEADNAIAEVERLYEKGIRGIKFHTGHQQFDFDNPKYFPLFRRIGSLGMATLIHCGTSLKSSEHQVWPSIIARSIECFNGAPFICAHMGGVTPEHPEFKLLVDLPVLVDTALSEQRMNEEQFKGAIELLGDSRVLFGSDLPWGNYQKNKRFLEISDLSEKVRHKIFYQNAEQLIKKLSK